MLLLRSGASHQIACPGWEHVAPHGVALQVCAATHNVTDPGRTSGHMHVGCAERPRGERGVAPRCCSCEWGRPRLPGGVAWRLRKVCVAPPRCRSGLRGSSGYAATFDSIPRESTKSRPATTECRLVSRFLSESNAAPFALRERETFAPPLAQSLFVIALTGAYSRAYSKGQQAWACLLPSRQHTSLPRRRGITLW